MEGGKGLEERAREKQGESAGGREGKKECTKNQEGRGIWRVLEGGKNQDCEREGRRGEGGRKKNTGVVLGRKVQKIDRKERQEIKPEERKGGGR